MALPTLTKAWTISPCNRITYVSLLDTMQNYLLGIKNFLVANGFTVKGSHGGGAAGMDGVDRWAAAASITPRGTIDAAVQAWVVLTSTGSGIDILLTYKGGTDDVCQISFSPGGLFVPTGPGTHKPSATDEVVEHNPTLTVIGTGVLDRLWSGWVSADARQVRFALASGGFWVGQSGSGISGKNWGVEEYEPVMEPPAYGQPAAYPTFLWTLTASGTVANATQYGRTPLKVASVATTSPGHAVTHLTLESWPLSATSQNYGQSFANEQPQLQGGAGYPILPLGIASNTSGFRGKIGNLIDCWTCRDGSVSGANGDTYGSLEFIVMAGYLSTLAGAGGGLWPWDGVTAPVMV